MSGDQSMIYGANGYAGALIVAHAITQGLKPVLAGRREEVIRPLAERYGLAFRIFGLDEPGATVRGLEGIGTLLLAAGPFSKTSAPAIDACIKTHTHYLDIAGEITVFEAAQRRNAAAKAARVVLLPGAGFDVVPSDCLAMALHQALPTATQLHLAIAVAGKPGPGSIKTAIEGAAQGGWIRRGGKLQQVPTAWRSARIPFAHAPLWAMTIPWGDISTAYWSTGIPDIDVYMATPRPAIWAATLGRPFMGLLRNEFLQKAAKHAAGALVSGGDESVRNAGGSWVWGRAEDADGNSVEGNVATIETTTLTAHTSVDIALRLQRGEVTPGYTTPALAFGEAYIRSFPHTRMTVEATS